MTLLSNAITGSPRWFTPRVRRNIGPSRDGCSRSRAHDLGLIGNRVAGMNRVEPFELAKA
jgi:hypothetical protein